MARLPDKLESIRETSEGNLGALGNARVYLRLVFMRVRAASRNGQETLMDPALDDIRAADALIKRVQDQCKECQVCRPAPKGD
jgi:hypothetical protein